MARDNGNRPIFEEGDETSWQPREVYVHLASVEGINWAMLRDAQQKERDFGSTQGLHRRMMWTSGIHPKRWQ